MIDGNVIYREAYKAIIEEDWFFDKDTTGAEVGWYVTGVANLTTRLLKEVNKKEESVGDNR